MAMSRKNYTEIAEAIHDSLDRADTPEFESGVADTARRVADVLKRDNPRFRYDFFFEACGLDANGYVE